MVTVLFMMMSHFYCVFLSFGAGVSMDVMLNFNRLKSITDDKEKICKALQKSKSGLMEVSHL